jgi:hypothetical protein
LGTITTKDGPTIYDKDWETGPVVTFSHQSTVEEVKGSHAVYVSQPQAVAAIVAQSGARRGRRGGIT